MIKAHYKIPKDELNNKYCLMIKSALANGYDNKYQNLKHLMNSSNFDTIDDILIADFYKLCTIANEYLNLNINDDQKKEVRLLFNYGRSEVFSAIKLFFEQYVSNQTCYYCNLEYTNAFVSDTAYQDIYEFLNNATTSELFTLPQLNNDDIKIIITLRRHNVIDVHNLPPKINDKIRDNNAHEIFNKYRNQFTLDHIIDKGSCEITAISLYNLLPTCYTCNCKLKREKSYLDKGNTNTLKISATSSKHSFSDDMVFKILANYGGKDVTAYTTSKLLTTKDYHIKLLIRDTDVDNIYEKFIALFKLNERYNYHIQEVLDLVIKRIDYPDTMLKSISDITGFSIEKIESDFFGKELFLGELHEKIMSKFKRDIAKQIRIIKE